MLNCNIWPLEFCRNYSMYYFMYQSSIVNYGNL